MDTMTRTADWNLGDERDYPSSPSSTPPSPYVEWWAHIPTDADELRIVGIRASGQPGKWTRRSPLNLGKWAVMRWGYYPAAGTGWEKRDDGHWHRLQPTSAWEGELNYPRDLPASVAA
jgi:hypothetical protein